MFLKSMSLRNYRSVRACDLQFDNPLFLVGRNGAGKSNVVDALQFMADCMAMQLEGAVEKRLGIGGIGNIDLDFGEPIALSFEFVHSPDQRADGTYTLRIVVRDDRSYYIEREVCRVTSLAGVTEMFDRSADGFVSSVGGLQPRLQEHGLVLPLIGGTGEFSDLVDSIASMRVYHVSYRNIRASDGAPIAATLGADGTNVDGVLYHLSKTSRPTLESINRFLATITPSPITALPAVMTNGGGHTFFDQQIGYRRLMTTLHRSQVSDGTLQALGIATALMQVPSPSVIVLEEPETNLHPGSLEAVADLIELVSTRTQVVVTTHSPDLLDAKWIGAENIRVVTWEDGATSVRLLGAVPQAALRDHLAGAGKLMRMNALDSAEPDVEDDAEHPDLFAPAAA
jgi:predicted ATPase